MRWRRFNGIEKEVKVIIMIIIIYMRIYIKQLLTIHQPMHSTSPSISFPQFFCSAWCCMVWNIPLTSLGQLSFQPKLFYSSMITPKTASLISYLSWVHPPNLGVQKQTHKGPEDNMSYVHAFACEVGENFLHFIFSSLIFFFPSVLVL